MNKVQQHLQKLASISHGFVMAEVVRLTEANLK